MQAASAFLPYPTTPTGPQRMVTAHTAPHNLYSFQPFNSSPLASPRTPQRPPAAAPSMVAVTEARRRASYKSRTSHSYNSFGAGSSSQAQNRTSPSAFPPSSPGSNPFLNPDAPGASPPIFSGSFGTEKALLRNQFKAKCLERAVQARRKAIQGKRLTQAGSDFGFSSSDGPDEMMDADDEEDDMLEDELFRRIMVQADKRAKNAYDISFSREFGSSFDPSLEEADTWEADINGTPPRPSPRLGLRKERSIEEEAAEIDFTPVDLDDEELEVYAEECARQAALRDFEDLPEEVLFGPWSDFEDDSAAASKGPEEMDMDL
ncbi:hypothetical protein BDN72DRAFT_962472 [Pluteus cervinus]|uniref:Uncharacterized protein n=1 Tax=Pluteus cervinus TaxID=181527 RepID=A0ACD3AIZ0_9AGAR|nr:hypothetical protein BDN72DRAFT_962472 [Pluteus cervinus]